MDFDLENIIKDKNFRIYDNGTVKECLGRCLDDGYFPLNVEGVRELSNKKVISKDKWYDTSTVLIDGVQRDAALDELKNIKDFYKKGGRVLFVSSRSGGGDISGSSYLHSDGRFVGVSLTSEAGAQKFKEYDDALKLLQSDKGREYLFNNTDKAMELYKALGPALVKSK